MKDREMPDQATAKRFLEDLLEIFEEIERLVDSGHSDEAIWAAIPPEVPQEGLTASVVSSMLAHIRASRIDGSSSRQATP